MAHIFDIKTSDLKGIQEANVKQRLDQQVIEVPINEAVSEFANKGEKGGGYNEGLWNMVAKARPHHKEEFYIEVIPYLDEGAARLGFGRLDTKMYDRMSCPTPALGHRVYRYTYHDNKLEELWVLPDKETAYEMTLYPIESRMDSPALFNYYMDYKDGTLQKLSNTLNKIEKQDNRFLVLNNFNTGS